MTFVTDIMPDPRGLGQRDAEAALSAFRDAIQNGNAADLPAGQKDLAARVGQANAKIASGAEIARISELMTLAQFGAGSVGAGIADALNDPAAIPALENLMTARFLVGTVLSAGQCPYLIPSDMLKKNNLTRDAISWPAAEPVYSELLNRAALALSQAATARQAISSKSARKLFDREIARCVRQARKINGKDPDSPGARLNGFDRLIISLTILLHIRSTP